MKNGYSIGTKNTVGNMNAFIMEAREAVATLGINEKRYFGTGKSYAMTLDLMASRNSVETSRTVRDRDARHARMITGMIDTLTADPNHFEKLYKQVDEYIKAHEAQ